MSVIKCVMAVSCSLIASFVWADDAAPITNFHQVSPGVYRGGAPGRKGIAYLKSLHVKTDIDLEGTRFWIYLPEKFEDHHAGIQFEHKPMLSLPGVLGDLTKMDEAKIDSILAVMADPKQQPVYVHCLKGEDRTGLIIGLYDVKVLHMKPKDAWADMLKYGYHPHFTALTKYFEKQTGFSPEAAPAAAPAAQGSIEEQPSGSANAGY